MPLNYSEPLEDSLVVALIRYPSPHQTDPALYKGPILFNPGGPGGSGVDFLLGTGKKYSDLFDGLYDIVSFDPRGTCLPSLLSLLLRLTPIPTQVLEGLRVFPSSKAKWNVPCGPTARLQN